MRKSIVEKMRKTRKDEEEERENPVCPPEAWQDLGGGGLVPSPTSNISENPR